MADSGDSIIHQLNGAEPAIKLASGYQLVSQDWPATAMVPYLAYMPEQDRLAMLVIYGQPGILYKGDPGLSFSDDHGATWSVPRGIPGAGMTLTYLGNGTLLSDHMVSRDFGETWEALRGQPGPGVWLPALVDRHPRTGRDPAGQGLLEPPAGVGHGEGRPVSARPFGFQLRRGQELAG